MSAPGTPAQRTFNINAVKGRRVIDSFGNDVGTIEDVVIEMPTGVETSRGHSHGTVEPGTWRVSGFLVNLKRDVATRFGVERKGMLDHPRIEIGAHRVQTVGDNVILNIATDVIADALRERMPPAPGAEREPFLREESAYAAGDGLAPPPPGVPPYEPPRY